MNNPNQKVDRTSEVEVRNGGRVGYFGVGAGRTFLRGAVNAVAKLMTCKRMGAALPGQVALWAV